MKPVVLPWPNKRLWPNRKNGQHWSYFHKEKKAAIRLSYFSAVAAGWKDHGQAQLQWSYAPPRKPGAMNLDNVIGACKAYQDGLAEALGVDDALLPPVYPEAFADPVPGGCVTVMIVEAQE